MRFSHQDSDQSGYCDDYVTNLSLFAAPLIVFVSVCLFVIYVCQQSSIRIHCDDYVTRRTFALYIRDNELLPDLSY